MNAVPMRAALAGKSIVVTRPARQCAALVAQLAAAGARAIVLPTIEILAPADVPALNAVIDRLEQFDLAIFISPNAAREALRAIIARRPWPAALQAAAIGSGSVRELARHGITNVIAPARFDSEGLLEMPALQTLAGKRIVIFRGDGGRELLGATLRARGAAIEYAACYRRGLPQADPAPVLAAWRDGGIDAVTVTSSEGLHNLCTLLGAAGCQYLRRTPLFVPHARIAAAAREAGCAQVVTTAQGDDGLVAGLVAWFAVSA
jgi:uroporphyrinogen-III synthase